jgi:hypothetical protein
LGNGVGIGAGLSSSNLENLTISNSMIPAINYRGGAGMGDELHIQGLVV